MILVDFDETITTTETTPLLGQFGLDYHGSSLPWHYFIDTYMEDYNRIKEQFPTNTTAPEERIKAFRAAEEASLARIHTRKVFQGLTRQQIFDHGQKLSTSYLRPDALDTLVSIKNNNGNDCLRIVSVNWSKDWIRGFLEPYLELSYDQICSNDLVYDDQGKATGEIQQEVLTSYDKRRVVQRIKHEIPQDMPIVYIGDSPGDVLPLVDANTGIVIGDNQRLLKAIKDDFHRTVVESIPSSSRTPGQPPIYRVDTWNQIRSSDVF
ncbi:HAD-like domain-containing protein [Zychaea mexicana]|uniref:HAD-like domain-containing protein n=1 Tax=Zychaea mexicana TaxID=64656 RepID=UPI0022FDF8F1|nr:HAD-like domain-containing protein [Zychaea mexicana]KAI9492543.1 HAD-like domain-containing protein [Zychaea mexicana]